jgi:hypothetical protein
MQRLAIGAFRAGGQQTGSDRSNGLALALFLDCRHSGAIEIR